MKERKIDSAKMIPGERISRAALILHARRGWMHRIIWHNETSKGQNCSECWSSAYDVLETTLTEDT